MGGDTRQQYHCRRPQGSCEGHQQPESLCAGTSLNMLEGKNLTRRIKFLMTNTSCWLDISTVQRDQPVNMEENPVRLKERLRLSERTLLEEH